MTIPAQPQLPLAIREGVHLRLPEAMHHSASALGQSDFPVLATDPASWWYGSPFNPDRRVQKRRNPYTAFGSALHALVLEGEQAYAERFVVEPEQAAGRYAMTLSETKQRLRDKGVHVPHGEFDPKVIYGLARRHGVADQVWELAQQAFARAMKEGVGAVTQDEDRRLRHMAKLVAEHPDLGAGLRQALSEVSVFWRRPEDPDTLLRARLDGLLPDFTLDLKTMGNWRGSNPDEATFDAIGDEEYDLQPVFYDEARRRLREFVAAGQVFAWDSHGENRSVLAHERAQLEAIAARETWRWVWVFYQVRNDDAGKARAPVIVPWWIHTDPAQRSADEDALFAGAEAVIAKALENFRTWRAKGMTEGWSEVRKIRRLPVEKLRKLKHKRTPQ